MAREVALPCCDAWTQASGSCSDNEEYGRLVYYPAPNRPQLGAHDLPPVRFCPWCGARKDAPQT